jgi:hypothetical protein
MSSVNSGYKILSDIKSFKRALGKVKLDGENKPKVLLKNHVNSVSALELTEGFVQSQNNTFFL